MSLLRRKTVTSKIELKVSSVELLGELKESVRKIAVELDLPGDTTSKSASQVVSVNTGLAAFKPVFTEAYDLRETLELRQAIIDALRTASEDDSELLLHVLDTTKSSKGGVIGSAAFRLEQALAMGQDHVNKPLSVRTTKGEEVGKITCTIICLAGLQDLQEDIKADAAKAWAEGTPEDGQLVVSIPSLRLAGTSKTRPAAVRLRVSLVGLPSAERHTEPVNSNKDG
eukprot:404229-Prymnesium_polylepis.3